MSVTWFLVVIFAFVLIKHGMDTRARQQRDRMRLLEEALQNGDLDEHTRAELMEVLTGRYSGHSSRTPPVPPVLPPAYRDPNRVGFIMRAIAFLGWMSVCLGIAFAILCNISRYYHDLEIPATILTCVGFGLVSYPMVIRELQTPRRASAAPQPREQRS
jgi:hypothetical protein